MRFGDAIRRYAASILKDREAAEDIAQEVMVRLLRSEEMPRHLKPWLFRVARNICLHRLDKASMRHGVRRAPEEQEMLRSMVGPLTRMVQVEQEQALRQAMETLSPEQSEVLYLRYTEELSRAETAEVLGIAEGLVKSRAYEGIQLLRAVLDA